MYNISTADKNFNPILSSDSYKITHWKAYPEKTQFVYSYLESRGGMFPETVFFGLQYYLKRYLSVPVTTEMIDYAEKRFKLHFGDSSVFNRFAWEHIVEKHNGYLPLIIKAVPEGLVVPTRNVLMTIENTDPDCYWLVNYMETLLMKVWYPITVATLSRGIKKVINKYLEETGDPAGLPFKLHDFGYRGVSSEESACIGGAANLVNFLGTDTFGALELLYDYYDEEMAGFSIPATEHSVMTARGQMGEVEQMSRFLDMFGQNPNFPAIACVSDQYDIFNACRNLWGGELKDKVMHMKNMLVVRPDSGDPVVVVVQVIETLDEKFGHTTNDKGFKVLNNVRVIQCDGVDMEIIRSVLEAMKVRGWSADNVAFGMGGALLQKCNRDTQRFALKASSIVIDEKQSDIFKNPVTDSSGKRSKAGRLKLQYSPNGVLVTTPESEPGKNILQTVWENGRPLVNTNLSQVRALASIEKVEVESL